MSLPFPPQFLSGLEIARLAREMDKELRGRFIQKIHLCRGDVLALQTYGDGHGGWLTFSASDRLQCLYISQEKPEHVPREPLHFANMLRHDIEGSRIVKVEQQHGDRVLAFKIERAGLSWTLICEIFGRQANGILIDESSTIRGSVRRSLSRAIKSGGTYTPPQLAEKMSLEDPLLPGFLNELEQKSLDYILDRDLSQKVSGLSPMLAREVEYRFRNQDKSLDTALREVAHEAGSAEAGAYLYLESGVPCLVSGVRLAHLGGEYTVEERPALLSALAALYDVLLPKVSFLAAKDNRLREIQNEIRKLTKDLEKARHDLSKADREEEFRLKGEMLLAHLHLARRGVDKVAVPNLYAKEGQSILVELDPTLTPSRNAENYFKKAGKAARTRLEAGARVKKLESKVGELEVRLAKIEASESEEDLEGILQVPKRPTGAKSKKKPEKIDLLRKLARVFTSKDGHQIWVGKGAKESDELLRRYVRGSDVWLHTRDLPGPHVIIHPENKGAVISHDAVLDGAHLAAHFGKAKGEKSVSVYMTEAKNLRRPKNAPPGKVTVGNDRGFDVRIEEERLKRLLEGGGVR